MGQKSNSRVLSDSQKATIEAALKTAVEYWRDAQQKSQNAGDSMDIIAMYAGEAKRHEELYGLLTDGSEPTIILSYVE